MDQALKNIQLQYQGYVNTPLLWKDQALLGLEQLELPRQFMPHFHQDIPGNVLLGKRVERFVYTELGQQENIQIILKNAQIQSQKITIGEIDCVLKKGDIPIHLEIIYKFYLYDPHIGSTEIDHWIGPNRKDSLIKKLHKLKDKQLPLLHNTLASPVLNKVGIDPRLTLQKVIFKAQLFKPFNESVDFNLLNEKCLTGFYIYTSQIRHFSTCEFYMPVKIDWLMEVQADVDWDSYEQFQKKAMALIAEKRAPLCWMKFPNGSMQKFFVVWWEQE